MALSRVVFDTPVVLWCYKAVRGRPWDRLRYEPAPDLWTSGQGNEFKEASMKETMVNTTVNVAAKKKAAINRRTPKRMDTLGRKMAQETHKKRE
jgi:hypothetical protein